MARRVFLPPLPRPIRLYLDRANRVPTPIRRNALAAENPVHRRPSHPWVFPAGSRTLPVASHSQFAQAPDPPPLLPQTFPHPRTQFLPHRSPYAPTYFPP